MRRGIQRRSRQRHIYTGTRKHMLVSLELYVFEHMRFGDIHRNTHARTYGEAKRQRMREGESCTVKARKTVRQKWPMR